MKYLKLSALGLVLAAVFTLVMYKPEPGLLVVEAVPPDKPSVVKNTNPPDTIPPEVAQLTTAETLGPVDWAEMKKRHGKNFDPMLMGNGWAATKVTSVEIDAYNKLHILPFNKVVGEDCRSTDSEVIESGVACQPIFENAPHPYTQLSDDDLEAMAETNAVAALLMVDRVRSIVLAEEEWTEELQIKIDRDKYTWTLRATALSEKSGPLMKFAESRIGHPYYEDPEGNVIPDPSSVFSRLLIESVADKLGDPRANPGKYRDLMMAYKEPNVVKEIEGWQEQLKLQVGSAISYMVVVQQEITGSNQVLEATDV